METVISKKTALRYLIKDIALDVTWSKISARYFGKSSSWMYHKLNGVDGNGKPVDFTAEEKVQLQNALFDFSERIRHAAESIK